MTAADSKHWSGVKEVGALWGIRTLVFVYRVFGSAVFAVLLYPVVGYFFARNGFARAASKDYLRRLAAYTGSDLAPNNRTSFRHFLSFARSIRDRLSALVGDISVDELVFPDRDVLIECVDQKCGALLIGAHIGSLEVCRALAKYRDDIRLNILVYTAHAKNINRGLSVVDERRNVELMEVSEINPGVAIRLKQKLDRGELIVIVADRIPPTSDRIVEVEFLGSSACFPQGPFILAALLRCPVFTFFCVKQGSKHRVLFERLSDRIMLRRGNREADLREYVVTYAARLAECCRLAPLQWFNFFPFWERAERRLNGK